MSHGRSQIVPAAPEHLHALAASVCSEPLFVRYGLGCAALQARWGIALARGDGMLVALTADGPQGLAWFTVNGAFCRAPYLRLLVVAPQIQSHGTGQALLCAFEAACHPAPGGYFVLCSDFNTRAQRFYQRFGYREVGRLPNFVLPDVAEVMFHKPASAASGGPWTPLAAAERKLHHDT